MSPLPVAAVDVLVNGSALDNALLSQLLDVQVRNDLLLPDTAVVRLRDPDGTLVDQNPLPLGGELQIKMGARADDATQPVFSGIIAALEPEFTETDCILAARAYDRAMLLTSSRKSRTFQNVSAADMVRKVMGEAGLAAGTVESTSDVYPYFQQSMETDWEFCRRLAAMNDLEFLVEERKFHFRKRKRSAPVLELTWGESLLTFRPRATAAGQPREVRVANRDPKAAADVVGTASTPDVKPAAQVVNGRARAVSTLGGGTVLVADRVASTGAEAGRVAQATLDRLASSFLEAEGRAHGSPKLKAGVTVKLAKVGPFSGEYVLSQTTHRFGKGDEYTTSFVISGRTGHGLSDLVRNGHRPEWSSALVVGIVTNNKDPDKMGRVRVKFPALGSEIEGWWARVATLNAGSSRGAYMLPQVNDEVIVAFEHGDTRRPIVLGSLFNGRTAIPGELMDADESKRKARFGIWSDEQVNVQGKQALTLRSGEKMTLQVQKFGQGGTGDYLLDAQGSVEEKAAQNVKVTAGQSIELAANQSVTIKGTGSITIESQGALKLKGAMVDIQSSGPVNVKGAMINLG